MFEVGKANSCHCGLRTADLNSGRLKLEILPVLYLAGRAGVPGFYSLCASLANLSVSP